MEVLTRTAYRKRRRLFRRFFFSSIVATTMVLGVVAAVVAYAYQLEPPSLSVPETTVIYSANEEVIGEFHQGQNRHWVPLEHMGDAIVEATIAVEDRRFYDHLGFDFFRIGGAVAANLRSNSMVQGASTITQQYARNLFLNHEKTWSRKWNEAMYALRLELHYTKREILEGYLNTIYYGHGAYGIEAAANIYFQKNAEELTKAEAAMLAGIPKGPSIYSPFVNFERAKQRQETVLFTMKEAGFITSSEMLALSEEELVFPEEDEIKAKRVAPYFQDEVMKWLKADLGIDPELVEHGGLEIHTTLDYEMQQYAEELVKTKLASRGELQTALVAMDPRTGEVRAMIGGKDYDESPFNRATQARRHPGSAIKPILYYAALEHGFRPNSMLLSEETKFIYDEGREDTSPSNFNHYYADDYVTMLQALAVSDNIYAMKVHFLLGFDKLVETAQRFGIKSPMNPNFPSLALGAFDAQVLEMTNSYSPFANGGYTVEPHYVTLVKDRDGNVIYEANLEAHQTINADLAAIMTDLMKGMFEPELSSYASVTGGSLSYMFDRPIAGKSGSNENNSWMIGYTPQLLTGVWVGYDRGDLRTGDGNYSKDIWGHLMQQALKDEPVLDFDIPNNVVEVTINPFNGMLATEHCPVQRPTLFYAGTAPTEYCSEHVPTEADVERSRDPSQKTEDEKKDKWLDKIFDWLN